MEPRRTLRGQTYRSPEVFGLEADLIFGDSWLCVGRAETVAEPRSYLATRMAEQNILVVRDEDGTLRGFHNVCRHRGAMLCDPGAGSTKRAFKCPYHAWSYGLDGSLIGTPNVGADEIDRAEFGLHELHVDIWAGCLFVHLGKEPEPLRDWLADQDDEPLRFERWPLDDLVVVHTTRRPELANWKIVVENYGECLHCPTVHPELVDLIPTYRQGTVVEADRPDHGVSLKPGAQALSVDGSTDLPLIPGFDEHEATSVYGAYLFPNAMLDITGTYVTLTRLEPIAPDRTDVVIDYLFHPTAIATEGFDPAPMVDFMELVSYQDAVVCERVQAGITSRAFEHGVYPEKDEALWQFNERYRASMGNPDL